MELTHRTNNIRIAPRKLRLVADQIKYKSAKQALSVLPLVVNRGALIIAKSLKAAITTAQDQNLDVDSLVIQRIWCDEGMKLKRMIGHSRGRMSKIEKKYSHLSIVLKGDQATRSRKRVAKSEEAVPAQPEVSAQPVAEEEK